MSRTQDQHCTAPHPPPPAVTLAVVVALLVQVFREVVPLVWDRPDLRLPLLGAVRALAGAAFRHLHVGGTSAEARRQALHRALAALITALEAFAAAGDEAMALEPVPPRDARLDWLGPVAAPGARTGGALARDGPRAPPLRCA